MWRASLRLATKHHAQSQCNICPKRNWTTNVDLPVCYLLGKSDQIEEKPAESLRARPPASRRPGSGSPRQQAFQMTRRKTHKGSSQPETESGLPPDSLQNK